MPKTFTKLKYIFLIYVVLQSYYDLWGGDAVNDKVIYYAFQFATLAAIAIVQALEGRDMKYYLVIALILISQMVIVLTWINKDAVQFAELTTGPPAYQFTTAVLVLLFYLAFSKKIKSLWSGLKITFDRRYS